MNQDKPKPENRRQIRHIAIFLIVVAVFLVYLFSIFDFDDDLSADRIFKTFYNMEEDTLDGVYLGSSAVYRYFMPTSAYEQEGYAIMNLATSSQPFVLNKYLIKEVLKTQPNSKVILIELRNLIKVDELLMESDIRRVTDSMRMSENRNEAIDAALAYYKSLGIKMDYNADHYYYPFLMYHSRWEVDMEPENLLPYDLETEYMGFLATKRTFKVVPVDDPGTVKGEEDLSEERMEIVRDLLEYCKGLDQTVIFVSAPCTGEKREFRQFNRLAKMIRAEGFTCWNFNSPRLRKQLGLDWSKDFYAPHHVNYYGAVKYTDLLIQKLKKKTDLPDHRGDPDYDKWQDAADRLHKKLDSLRSAAEAKGQR